MAASDPFNSAMPNVNTGPNVASAAWSIPGFQSNDWAPPLSSRGTATTASSNWYGGSDSGNAVPTGLGGSSQSGGNLENPSSGNRILGLHGTSPVAVTGSIDVVGEVHSIGLDAVADLRSSAPDDATFLDGLVDDAGHRVIRYQTADGRIVNALPQAYDPATAAQGDPLPQTTSPVPEPGAAAMTMAGVAMATLRAEQQSGIRPLQIAAGLTLLGVAAYEGYTWNDIGSQRTVALDPDDVLRSNTTPGFGANPPPIMTPLPSPGLSDDERNWLTAPNPFPAETWVLPPLGSPIPEMQTWRDLIVTSTGLPPGGAQPLDWSRTNPAGESAIDHVNLHGVDDLTKPTHGVFVGNPILTTESAWAQAAVAGTTPVLQPNGKIRYDVDMGAPIGWQGGFNGSGAPLSTVRIVTTPSGQVVTSFPR